MRTRAEWDKRMKILRIPPKFVKLCGEWHNGQSSMMYAVSSTGSLSLGTIKPIDCDTEEEWFRYLLDSLSKEVELCIVSCGGEDIQALNEFADFLKKESYASISH